MPFDLTEVRAQLEAWLTASRALARNKSYTQPDGRTLTRADGKEIRANIDYFRAEEARLMSGQGGVRVRRVTPL